MKPNEVSDDDHTAHISRKLSSCLVQCLICYGYLLLTFRFSIHDSKTARNLKLSHLVTSQTCIS